MDPADASTEVRERGWIRQMHRSKRVSIKTLMPFNENIEISTASFSL
jgi:hypothetical protein